MIGYEAIIRQSSAIIALIVFTSSAIICAPSQNHQATSLTPASAVAASPAPSRLATNSTPKSTTESSISSSASVSNGAPSHINLRDMDTFNGRNPFSDASLWQIPVHLVRDFAASDTAGSHDKLAKSSSEHPSHADADKDEDEDYGPPLRGQQVNLQPSLSSSSPTVISASTDLKTAAGYHHSTHGHGYGHDSHGYGAGHGSGNYGGHAGDHYGGKYFQYASVPYPYAWDFGYRRGNPYHTIERYEHGKGPHFQTKVKWSDKHGGYGVHVWDYNHDDHHSHHYGGHHGHYGHH